MSTSLGAEGGDPRPSLTQYAVGSAALAADSLRQLTRGTARVARRLGRRGNEAVAERREQLGTAVRGATDAPFDWIASAIAPQLIDRLIPYLSKEAAPKIVDQMLPYISADVAPKLIEQLLPHISEDVAPRLIDQLMPRLTEEVA